MKGLLLLFVFAIPSCAFRSYIYKKIPSYITDKLDDEVDYTWNEEDTVEKKVQIEIRKRVSDLKVIESIILNPNLLSDEGLSLFAEQIVIQYKSFGAFISILLAEKIATYNRDDMVSFMKRQYKKNNEILNRAKDQNIRAQERLEKFFGELNPNQLDLVKEYTQAGVSRAIARIEKRKKILHEIESCIKSKLIYNAKKDILYALFKKYVDQFDKTHNGLLHFMQVFIKTLDVKQKEKFKVKQQEVLTYLQEYIEYQQSITL